MIINVDAKGLEWVVGTFLCQDKIAIQEIRDGVDQHKGNQIAFKLTGWEDAQAGLKTEQSVLGRLIAKIFVFR